MNWKEFPGVVCFQFGLFVDDKSSPVHVEVTPSTVLVCVDTTSGATLVDPSSNSMPEPLTE